MAHASQIVRAVENLKLGHVRANQRQASGTNQPIKDLHLMFWMSLLIALKAYYIMSSLYTMRDSKRMVTSSRIYIVEGPEV